MRLTATPELLIAGLSGALILGAATWWTFAESSVVTLGPPTIKADPVVVVRATVPVIGDFQRDYYTNDLDPFVPYEQRMDSVQHIKNHRFHPTGSPTHPKVTTAPLPPPPIIHWPTASKDAPVIPICVGWVSTEGGSCLLVRMSNGPGAAVSLHIGDGIPAGADSAHQWTLESISEDGMATFRDPSGKDEIFPIGGPQQDPPASDGAEPVNGGNGPKKPQADGGPGQQPNPQAQPKRPRRPRVPPNMVILPNGGGVPSPRIPSRPLLPPPPQSGPSK